MTISGICHSWGVVNMLSLNRENEGQNFVYSCDFLQAVGVCHGLQHTLKNSENTQIGRDSEKIPADIHKFLQLVTPKKTQNNLKTDHLEPL